MIAIERLLYGIDQKLNKVASNQHQFISVEDKLLFLNRNQINLIKNKITTNNLFQLGFDSFTLRYQDLQELVVQYEELPVSKSTEVYESYKTDLRNTKSKYFLPVSIIAVSSKGKCKDRIINVNQIVKHSDLPILMNNNHFNPSFDYQETLAVISDFNLLVYSKDFQVNKILLSYLRYPVEMDYEGYEKLDGSESTTVNCELPDYLEDELLNMTVSDIAYSIGDIQTGQINQSPKS